MRDMHGGRKEGKKGVEEGRRSAKEGKQGVKEGRKEGRRALRKKEGR